MNNSYYMKSILLSLLNDLTINHREFLSDPDRDFTRNRKLSWKETMMFILTMEGGSSKGEMVNYFGPFDSHPTLSAVIQQRSKIRPEAFEWLFRSFNKLTHHDDEYLYRGYRLMAIDGSCITIRTDRNDSDTYISQGDDRIGYNAYHLNAMFDILGQTYHDVVIQNGPHKNEKGAFNEMVDRYEGEKAIFIADRGYESLNSFEHVNRSGNRYLVRVRDVDSRKNLSGSFTRSLDLEDEFDIDSHRLLTRKQTNEVKNHPELYKLMVNRNVFDFFDEEPFYDFSCRILRFKVEDREGEAFYETVFTNLDRDEFPADEIRRLYSMRWGIETSFRNLKYPVKLNSFHSKKNEFIIQEIYARLIFYNFSRRITERVEVRRKEKAKHDRKVNFSMAVNIIRSFLRTKEDGSTDEPPAIETILSSITEPIRAGRSYPINKKPKSAVPYNGR